MIEDIVGTVIDSIVVVNSVVDVDVVTKARGYISFSTIGSESDATVNELIAAWLYPVVKFC